MRAILLLMLVCLSACSGGGGSDSGASAGPCAASSLNGAWLGTISGSPDLETFTASCTGTGSYCGNTFTYTATSGLSGTVSVLIAGSNGNVGCLSNGVHSCTYLISGTSMGYNCGSGTATYTKQ